jgi:bifunctional non-homologous end joining protein LigD
MPEHLRPMLARPSELPADDEGWAFEIKWDGVRAIAYWRAGELRLESRNLNDVSSQYPELTPLGRQLGAHEAVLDGEIVAFDDEGHPSFERLQKRMHLTGERSIRRLAAQAPVTYVVFDLLHLDGRRTMGLPYSRRRELLAGLRLGGPTWQAPPYHEGEGQEFLAATAEYGLEGVMAKRLDSPYRPATRSGDWLKVKNSKRQELVIGGWLPGKGRRSGQIGALLVGYHEPRDGRHALRFAGRAGSGFDERELRRLGAELTAREREQSPFSSVGVQPPKEARFVEPELVAEVRFTGWTREGVLRHPVYLGQRLDKPAEEVELEASAVEDIAAERTVSEPLRGLQVPTSGEVGEKMATQTIPYDVVHQTKRYTDVEVEGRRLRLSNREKTLYPRAGFTKGRLIDYYAAVAPVLLPHLKGRPLTLKRYPDGVDSPHFYEKRCPAHRPDWVRTVPIWSERNKQEIPYCVVEDLPTLIWAANLANIELHTSLSPARSIGSPTMVVFDLDPGPPAGIRDCCRVALWLKELFDAFDLRTVAKTSGSKGLQVYLPLNFPTSYEHTKPFARAVAELLEKQHAKLVTSRMTKSLRPGKVFIDWSQNDEHKTTVCVYSLRATARPLVSTPLTWDEVRRASRRRSDPQLSAEPAELLRRVERDGDLFAPLLDLRQGLPHLS